MITVVCNKCGKKEKGERDSSITFSDRRFSYLARADDEPLVIRTIHLCLECQKGLQQRIDRAIADFISEEEIQCWKSIKGLIV